MDRRRFLATATAASALPLAGCSAVGVGTTDLGARETTTEAGETHLTFSRNGRRLLTFSVMPRGTYAESGGRVPLRIDASHASGTRLDSFRMTVRAPADGSEPTTEIYLRTPWFGDDRSLDFRRGDDGRTVTVAVDDLGEDGDATLSMEFLLDPASTPETLPVLASGEFEFSETEPFGREYRAEGRATVEFARERDPRE